ncbi:MAG: hypothetical protein V9H26_02095 [Verrucomicrobiota bacterium]|nr:hypothetical protein [Limisphaerales bacterium]
MKKTSHLFALGAALLLPPLTSTFAQSTWQTVDDYQYAPGKAAINRGVAASADGTLFVAGAGADAAGVNHGVVHRSLDGGVTWDMVLDVPSVNLLRIAINPLGEVLAVGTQSVIKGKWVTYRSSDGGLTWLLADQFQFSSGGQATAWSVTADTARIYVSGTARDAKNVDHWVVRRSADGGLTWTTADNLPLQGATASIGITVTPSGSVIAVGYTAAVWTVRRSTDGGNTWATVDKFKLGNYMSVAKGITADANGNLYVTGSAGKGHWITRKSTTGGISWTTVDDFTLNGSGIGMGVAVDEFGRVFVGGSSSGSSPRWIVRTSSDAGATWVTTDDYRLASPSNYTSAEAVAGDAGGNVFVVGGAWDAAGVTHAIIRKLTP